MSWLLRPSRISLSLNAENGEAFVLHRDDYDSRINYNAISDAVVFRFDSGTREVGFLVPEFEAQRLLDALQWTNTGAVASSARVVQAAARTVSWQTMTPVAVLALALAVCAFVPFAGAALAVGAVVCMCIARHQAARSERLRHVRPLTVACFVLLVVALSACTLGTWIVLRGPGVVTPLSDARVPTISPASKVLAVLIVLLALSVHECAHAVVAWWCGDLGPLTRGRVTLNPFAHIDPIGTVLVPAVLVYMGGMIFGWARPVRVTLQGVPKPRRANILISAAGPFSNLILALMFLSLYIILGSMLKLWAPQARVDHYGLAYYDIVITGMAAAKYVALLATFLKWGIYINLILFFFNLIPIPPLDGGHVLGSLFPRVVGSFYRKLGPFTLIIFLSLIASGVLQLLLRPAEIVIHLSLYLVQVITQL